MNFTQPLPGPHSETTSTQHQCTFCSHDKRQNRDSLLYSLVLCAPSDQVTSNSQCWQASEVNVLLE